MSLYGGRVPRKSLEEGRGAESLFEKVQMLLETDPWQVVTPVLLGVGMAVALLGLLLFLEDRNTARQIKAEVKTK
jgi:hypothetical protein